MCVERLTVSDSRYIDMAESNNSIDSSEAVFNRPQNAALNAIIHQNACYYHYVSCEEHTMCYI